MKILLLEDDYNYNESIKEYLEMLDFEVDSFFNGEDALDAIMQNFRYKSTKTKRTRAYKIHQRSKHKNSYHHTNFPSGYQQYRDRI